MPTSAGAPSGFADQRALLRRMFDAAVAAADPLEALRPHMPDPPEGRCVVIGAGKGAAQLAAAFETLWTGPVEGVVVTRYGYGAPTRRIRVMEAAHPEPDAAGLEATAALFDAVRGLCDRDLVVSLICGGGSALLPAPAEGMTLEDEIAVNRALLASGAPISAMNAIRAQISRIKAGRLARAAAPARVLTLAVSDIPGDDPTLIASGPTTQGGARRETARAALDQWRIALPEPARRIIASDENTPPDANDPAFARCETRIIASAARSLEAAAAVAEEAGYAAAILSDSIEGEAHEAARFHGAMAREIATRSRPFAPPVALLSGGETTVTLRGASGRGGRNGEFALALAAEIAGAPVAALAADTDGIDGSGDNAGAFADGETGARLRALGLDPAAMLAAHDSYGAFERIDDLLITGPTGTNVNDFRAVLVGAPRGEGAGRRFQ